MVWLAAEAREKREFGIAGGDKLKSMSWILGPAGVKSSAAPADRAREGHALAPRYLRAARRRFATRRAACGDDEFAERADVVMTGFAGTTGGCHG